MTYSGQMTLYDPFFVKPYSIGGGPNVVGKGGRCVAYCFSKDGHSDTVGADPIIHHELKMSVALQSVNQHCIINCM